MTLRELVMTVSTANYCHYYIKCLHKGEIYQDVNWRRISAKYKDMQVYSATPVKCSFCSVKEWHICLSNT